MLDVQTNRDIGAVTCARDFVSEAVDVIAARGFNLRPWIEDGDLLFVQACSRFDADAVYVLDINGVLCVRRLRLRVADGMVRIDCDDEASPEWVHCSALDGSGREGVARVVGLIVGIQRRM